MVFLYVCPQAAAASFVGANDASGRASEVNSEWVSRKVRGASYAFTYPTNNTILVPECNKVRKRLAIESVR
jgi:hypothetical protein